jgi:cytochrome P450
MSLRERVMLRFVEPAVLGVYQWRGDPVARLMRPDTKLDPYHIAVICHLLGVPAEDQASFRVWGHDVATSLEPHTTRTLEHDPRSSELALTAYLRGFESVPVRAG